MPGPATGHRMKLYRNTGTAAIPVWVLVSEVGDVNIPDLARGMAELKRRAKDFTKNLATLIQSFTLEFALPHGLDPTTFTALRTAFFAGTAEEWAVMDGLIATSGSQGLRCAFLMRDFPWQQNLEDVSSHDVALAVAYWESPSGTEIDPSWYTVP